MSSEPELTEELSLMDAPLDAVDTAGVGFPLLSSTNGDGFMETRIDAASRSWTCWCLEMRSFEVSDHSGVCSHLFHSSGTAETTLSKNSQCKTHSTRGDPNSRKAKISKKLHLLKRRLCKRTRVCNALIRDQK